MSKIPLYLSGHQEPSGYYTPDELTAEHRCGDVVFHYDPDRKGKRRHEPVSAERVFCDASKLRADRVPTAQGNWTIGREGPEGTERSGASWWAFKPVYELDTW